MHWHWIRATTSTTWLDIPTAALDGRFGTFHLALVPPRNQRIHRLLLLRTTPTARIGELAVDAIRGRACRYGLFLGLANMTGLRGDGRWRSFCYRERSTRRRFRECDRGGSLAITHSLGLDHVRFGRLCRTLLDWTDGILQRVIALGH